MGLEQRVERLERRNRRNMIWMAAAFAIAIVSMGAMQKQRAKPSDSVDTKMLKLFDDEGNLRAFIVASPRGNAGLTIVDKAGHVCAVLGVGPEGGPSLELSHTDQKLRARLAVTAEGAPYLEMYDADKKVILQEPKEN